MCRHINDINVYTYQRCKCVDISTMCMCIHIRYVYTYQLCICVDISTMCRHIKYVYVYTYQHTDACSIMSTYNVSYILYAIIRCISTMYMSTHINIQMHIV